MKSLRSCGNLDPSQVRQFGEQAQLVFGFSQCTLDPAQLGLPRMDFSGRFLDRTLQGLV